MIKIFSLTFLLLLLVCCQSAEQSERGSVSQDPKTLYGQSVKKARDLQAPSKEEEETQRQVEELLENE